MTKTKALKLLQKQYKKFYKQTVARTDGHKVHLVCTDGPGHKRMPMAEFYSAQDADMVVQLLNEVIEDNKPLVLKGTITLKDNSGRDMSSAVNVTYHDPCAFGHE